MAILISSLMYSYLSMFNLRCGFIYYSIDLVCSSNFFLSVTSGLLFWLRDFIQGNDDVFTHLDETDNASLRLGPYEFSNKRNLSFCNNRRVSNLKVIYNSVDPSK